MIATIRLLVAAVAAALVLTGPAAAADPAPTTISIPGMHCAGCAKKVTTQLTELAGVAKAEADMKTKTIKVTPKAKITLSPKALWEAVEKVDQEPTKLVGPNGTFEAKPKI